MTEPTCCCSDRSHQVPAPAPRQWTDGVIATPVGPVPRIKTRLGWRDRLGGLAVRWGIGRGRYRVAPGLYAIGQPLASDRVLVTGNYKLTLDWLRRELAGRNLWLLVLDTRGINVWCAAGKGTFATGEVIGRIQATGLERVVSQRSLILPQLAAPGVAAHEVKAGSGFSVVYGPVRAADLPRFLDAGLRADAAMRTVAFTVAERLRVVPVELAFALKYYLFYLILVVAGLFLAGHGGWPGVIALAAPVLGAIVAGTVLVPLLLPVIPLRSFAWQGLLVGLVMAAAVSWPLRPAPLQWVGNLLLLPVLSAILALNFTGSTTFTCQSGVNREIALYARPLAIAGVIGGACMLANLFM
jgi:hypothetical protein